MLRMPGFKFHAPHSAQEAVALMQRLPNAMYVAGGTDLLPNIKHRIFQPEHVIGLANAVPLGWSQVGDVLVIGAGTTLSQLSTLTAIPALAHAAGLVAGPQIRNMGTLGGNVLLDTRCVYYNQSEFWRKALGHCLKCEGTWCHVIASERTCVATQSSDTVPLLLAMDASLDLIGPDGARSLPLRSLYHFDGKQHLKLQAGELLTHVRVPMPGPGARSAYKKLRVRGGIDFPMLGVGIAGRFSGTGAECRIDALDIVIGAINPQPRPVKGVEAFVGRVLDDKTIDQLAALATKRARPQASVWGPGAPADKWRRSMVGVYVRDILRALRAQA